MKKKIKLNYKRTFLFLLCILLIVVIIFKIINIRIKNIIVDGNTYLSDSEVIALSGLEDYPNIWHNSKGKIVKNLTSSGQIESVKVSINYLGKVTITVTENKPLFINTITGKVVLENNKEIDYSSKYLGLPSLINYVANDDVYNNFVIAFAKIDDGIIRAISEIEYSVYKNGDTIYDEERFLLRMNDGNSVYINIPNIKKLNNYFVIYNNLSQKGILYLDSNSENYIFKEYGE